MLSLKKTLAGALALGLVVAATEAYAQGIRGAGSKAARNYFPQSYAASPAPMYRAPAQTYVAPAAPSGQIAGTGAYRSFAYQPGYRSYAYQPGTVVAPQRGVVRAPAGPTLRSTPSYMRADSKAQRSYIP